MSGERAAFLRAICTDPTDDLPRLVFADWLEENDEAGEALYLRGELQLQLPHPPKDVREGEDYQVHSLDGKPPTRRTVTVVRGIPGVSVVVHRGFVKEVRCTLAVFLDRAARLFSEHPVTDVVLTDREPEHVLVAWHWRHNVSHRFRYHLPADLFRAVCEATGDFRFPTCDAAKRALSRGSVDYGRSLVGLPPLNCPVATRDDP